MYPDADVGGDLDKTRGTSGIIASLNGEAVLCGSKLRSVVATSAAEAEYIAGAYAAKEALWLRKVLGDIYGTVTPVVMYCDNQGALQIY
jgi:hypothetical protein